MEAAWARHGGCDRMLLLRVLVAVVTSGALRECSALAAGPLRGHRGTQSPERGIVGPTCPGELERLALGSWHVQPWLLCSQVEVISRAILATFPHQRRGCDVGIITHRGS